MHFIYLLLKWIKEKNLLIIKKKKIGSSIHYIKPLHKHEGYRNILKFDKLKNTENLCKRIVSLPLNDNLSFKDCIKVSNTINTFR